MARLFRGVTEAGILLPVEHGRTRGSGIRSRFRMAVVSSLAQCRRVDEQSAYPQCRSATGR